MAKKRGGSKITDRFARHEAKRVTGTRQLRRYYLIVCEGEKTERLYFEGLKRDMPPGVLQVTEIEVVGTGDNTLNLVQKARARKKEREQQTGLPVDCLWVVFDKDAFPSENFNKAIELCEHENIGCAWSNEAFELWYLLHFQYFDTSIDRRQYLEMLTRHLQGQAGQNFRYEKNSVNFYHLLKKYGNPEQAIVHACRLSALYEDRRDYANHNPCTKIHLLVQELKKLT